MRIFESQSLYDSSLGQYIEHFWIDGEETDCDTYFQEIENEKYIEEKKLKEENNCYDCCDYNEMLDYFVGRILDTGGCPECIKEVLDQFADLIEDVIIEEFEEE